MTNMRDKIADIIGKQTFMDSPSFVADAILEAMPDRIAPLVWEHIIQELPND